MQGQVSGLIFDMDGTMVDNMRVHELAWQEMLESVGIEMSLQEIREKVHGVNVEILVRLFGDRFTPADREQLSNQKEENYRRIFKDRLRLMPGLQEFLNAALDAQIPLALASAAPPENVDFILDNLQIRHLFDSVLHSQDVHRGKPDPEVFLKTAEKIDVPIERCIIFEDSLVGIEAAKRAGARAVVVTTSHQVEDFAHFDHILKFIDDFTELSFAEFR